MVKYGQERPSLVVMKLMEGDLLGEEAYWERRLTGRGGLMRGEGGWGLGIGPASH